MTKDTQESEAAESAASMAEISALEDIANPHLDGDSEPVAAEADEATESAEAAESDDSAPSDEPTPDFEDFAGESADETEQEADSDLRAATPKTLRGNLRSAQEEAATLKAEVEELRALKKDYDALKSESKEYRTKAEKLEEARIEGAKPVYAKERDSEFLGKRAEWSKRIDEAIFELDDGEEFAAKQGVWAQKYFETLSKNDAGAMRELRNELQDEFGEDWRGVYGILRDVKQANEELGGIERKNSEGYAESVQQRFQSEYEGWDKKMRTIGGLDDGDIDKDPFGANSIVSYHAKENPKYKDWLGRVRRETIQMAVGPKPPPQDASPEQLREYVEQTDKLRERVQNIWPRYLQARAAEALLPVVMKDRDTYAKRARRDGEAVKVNIRARQATGGLDMLGANVSSGDEMLEIENPHL